MKYGGYRGVGGIDNDKVGGVRNGLTDKAVAVAAVEIDLMAHIVHQTVFLNTFAPNFLIKIGAADNCLRLVIFVRRLRPRLALHNA